MSKVTVETELSPDDPGLKVVEVLRQAFAEISPEVAAGAEPYLQAVIDRLTLDHNIIIHLATRPTYITNLTALLASGIKHA